MELYEHYNEPVVALERVDPAKVSRYGVIDGTLIADDLYLIRRLVEKPSVDEAPSNLTIASRYALGPRIFDYMSIARPLGRTARSNSPTPCN